MAKGRKKRAIFNPLSLAFLDVMSCGFGAVVLLFLILDHTAQEQRDESDPRLQAEVMLLDREITEGEEMLARLRNTLDTVSLEVVEAQGRANRIQNEIDEVRRELTVLEGSTLASDESVEQLMADIRSLEEDILRLQSESMEEVGTDARSFLGQGQRQYLSGLYMGGNRILVLVDMSASMLDESLVNIIRTRNMPLEYQRQAPKWQRTVHIVDWLTSQFPVASQYQVMGFNEEVFPILEGTEGMWLEVADRDELDELVRRLGDRAPARGSNLQRAFQAAREMSPPPDNIYLITDSLPTQSNRPPRGQLITPRERMELFWEAIESRPANVPVNTVLLPMEGDPGAAAVFWELAILTRGSFITPSRDWP
jgi:hypothetical protein